MIRRFDVKMIRSGRTVTLLLIPALAAILLLPSHADAQRAGKGKKQIQAPATDKVRAEIFREIDLIKQQADLADAAFLAPESYAMGLKNYETALRRYEKGERLKQMQKYLDLAREHFEKSIEAAKITSLTLEETLELRRLVREKHLDRHAPDEYAKAERRLAAVVAETEKGDLRSARSESDKIAELYRETILAGYRDGPLKDAERALSRRKRDLSRRESEEQTRSLEGIKDWMDGYKGREFSAAEFIGLADEKLDGILGLLYPEFYRHLPDTLLIGDFVLKVVSYEDKGYYDFDDKTAKTVAGLADMRFDCGHRFFLPVFPGTPAVMERAFSIVGTVVHPESELSIDEARRIDPMLSIGDTVTLPLRPSGLDRAGIMEAKLDYFGRLDLLPSAGGVRVRFTNATIEEAGRPTRGRITAGTAVHPAAAADTGEPAAIRPAGFTVLMDSLVITPSGATAWAKIGLPRSIIDAHGCTLATVDIGETAITARCELYKEMPDADFGPFIIDKTGMVFRGTGFVIDLSTTRSPSGLGLAADWRGMVLDNGSTIQAASGSVTANTGYLKAWYLFSNALVTAPGIKSRFTLNGSYLFNCLVPYGYGIEIRSGFVDVDSSAVAGGTLERGRITIPRRAADGHRIPGTSLHANFTNLTVQKDMDLVGSVALVENNIYWGDLTRAGEEFIAFSAKPNKSRTDYAWFYLAGHLTRRFVPTSPADFTGAWYGDIPIRLEERQAAGITIMAIDQFDIFTADVPGGTTSAISFRHGSGCSLSQSWLNIEALGVSGEVVIRTDPMSRRLGDPSVTYYRGGVPFEATFECEHGQKEECLMVQWASSAVHDSEFSGILNLGGPSAVKIPYRDLELTSTAGIVGGKIDLGGGPVELDYWGVELGEATPGEPAGVLSVKTGQIILTQAGIREPRHFDEMFKLIWGEMLADGNLGELFFDFNSANQRFDGFLFTPHHVALSRYDPGTAGYLHACGDNHFGFFGSNYLSIRDAKYTGDDPIGVHGGRAVEIFPRAEAGCAESELRLAKGWGFGISALDFEIAYDANDQDGFLGEGTVELPEHFSGPLQASIQIDRDAAAIGLIGGSGSNFSLEAVDIGSATEVWGCIMIDENTLSCMTIGFTLESTAQSAFGILGGAGQMIEAKLVVKPTVTTFAAAGLMYLDLSLGGNVSVDGSILLIADRGEGSIFGDFQGEFNFSSLFAGFQAEGHVNWFLSPETQYLQGRAGISVYGRSLGSGGIAGGIFIGNNVPKGEVWVMTDTSNKFAVNMTSFPARITGVYGFGYADFSFDFGIFGGGIEIYAGVGAFLNMMGSGLSEAVGLPLPYVLANIGVALHGEILWGLVSASAWVNLQMMLGDPFYFQGTAGLEGCVLWVLCASVDVTIRLDEDGFDIY